MTVKPPVVPEGYHTGHPPGLSAKDAGGLPAFIGKVFGGKEKGGSRIMNARGLIDHGGVQLGDSVIMLFDHRDGWQKKTHGFLRIYPEDAKDTVIRAHEAGGTIITEVTSLFLVRTSEGTGTRGGTSGGSTDGLKRWMGRRW